MKGIVYSQLKSCEAKLYNASVIPCYSFEIKNVDMQLPFSVVQLKYFFFYKVILCIIMSFTVKIG